MKEEIEVLLGGSFSHFYNYWFSIFHYSHLINSFHNLIKIVLRFHRKPISAQKIDTLIGILNDGTTSIKE